jgi:hypothetical protein
VSGKSFANGNGATESGPGNSGIRPEVSQPNHWWLLVNGVPAGEQV